MRNRPHSSSISARVASGRIVTGSVTMPFSERLTRSTCSACSWTDRLRCSTPRPPWRAIAMAIRLSVTVSMAADSSGMRTSMLRVSRLVVSASEGMTSVSPGRRSTSSKVRPSMAKASGTSDEGKAEGMSRL